MKKAFTLIELLVVIAIIAILAAILFPVFAQAKEAAKSTQCLSNMKNIGTSAKIYSNDYDDQLLPSENWGVIKTGGTGLSYPAGISNLNTGSWPNPEVGSRLAGVWTTTIQPYMKSFDILFCPSYSEAAIKKAMELANCDGNGAVGSGWNLGVGFVFPADTQTGAGNKGILSHYAVAFASIGSKYAQAGYSIYSGVTDCTSAVYGVQTDCPYFNTAGTGLENGQIILGANGLDTVIYLQQDLTETAVNETSRTMFLGEGLTSLYTRTSSGKPRVFEALGCEGQFRHKGGQGSNYGFLDTHAKYIGPAAEAILTTDSAGKYYIKYMSYDK